MLEIALSIAGLVGFVIVGILIGICTLAYIITKLATHTGALLIAYDAYEDKVQILNSNKFEYKIFDK